MKLLHKNSSCVFSFLQPNHMSSLCEHLGNLKLKLKLSGVVGVVSKQPKWQWLVYISRSHQVQLYSGAPTATIFYIFQIKILKQNKKRVYYPIFHLFHTVTFVATIIVCTCRLFYDALSVTKAI
jgi:hypothetical protein